jgi:hypothetical protein
VASDRVQRLGQTGLQARCCTLPVIGGRVAGGILVRDGMAGSHFSGDVMSPMAVSRSAAGISSRRAEVTSRRATRSAQAFA